VSESLLATTEAYFRALAAGERLVLLRETLATDRQLGTSVEQLIAADELPRITQARIDARIATQLQSVAAAEQAVTQARVALADAMGLEVDSGADLPLATGSFPPVVDAATVAALDPESLLSKALEQRYDLRSAERATEGSAILREASRLDLKRPLDLTFAFGYSGLHESFSDEYYDPSGFGEALTGRQAGPSAFLGLRLDFPLRNRAARGRLAQSEAVASRSEVQEDELRRSIGARISGLAANLATAAAEVERRQAAADFRRQELDAELERFGYGESTLIESILSEENLTFSRLDLVDALLDYALAFSRLRFELGDLTVVEDEDGRLVIAARDPQALFELPAEEGGP
jgi:outer membrane protein TolC